MNARNGWIKGWIALMFIAWAGTAHALPTASVTAVKDEIAEGAARPDNAARFRVRLSEAPGPTGWGGAGGRPNRLTVKVRLAYEDLTNDRSPNQVDTDQLGVRNVRFIANQTEKIVKVYVNDDTIPSNDTRITAQVIQGQGYNPSTGNADARVTVTDPDKTKIGFEGCGRGLRVNEGAGHVNAKVIAGKPADFNYNVLVINIPASAGAGNDYVQADADGSIAIPNGETEATIKIGIVDSAQLEGEEVFDISLFHNGLDTQIELTTGSTGCHTSTITIIDDDTAVINAGPKERTVIEGEEIKFEFNAESPDGPHQGCLIPFYVWMSATPAGDTSALSASAQIRRRIPPCGGDISNPTTASFTTRDTAGTQGVRTVSFSVRPIGSAPDGSEPETRITAEHDEYIVHIIDKTTDDTGNGAMRLSAGRTANEGRVEVYHDSKWGTVCDDYWTKNNADVACRVAGYEHGSVENSGDFRRAFFGRGTGPIHLDDVRCRGNETSLFGCQTRPVGTNNCGHNEDVGVRCLITASANAGGEDDERGTTPPRIQGLAARLENLPSEHDGASAFDFELHFSEAPQVGWRNIKNGVFTITNATIEGVSRILERHNEGWRVTMKPTGNDDISIVLSPTLSCAAPNAICTSGGTPLSIGLARIVPGPVTVSVADASVQEAEGATLDFEVTLSRALGTTATVDYHTSNGSARAGEDYDAASGRLTFEAGAVAKTVSVTVRDDAVDEGGETMTLTLSNPAGVKLGDATATGTINNTGAMPKEWMVRLGRTVGSQVVDALTQRLDGAGGSHVTVAGINVIGETGVEPQAKDDDPFGLPEWAKNTEREALTANDIWLRSAFHLSSGGDATQGGGPAFTAWGRVATGGFEAEADGVTMDGDVTTGLVGFDAEWERALAGIMFSQSTGDGTYRQDTPHGNPIGAVESSLTGVYPYASLDLSARVSAWALAGVGSGELMLKREGHRDMPADISMRMGAVGVKGQVLDGTGASGLAMHVKSDAMWVGTKSGRTSEMVATEGDVTRLRLILQGERVFESGNGARFTPSAEVGLRHDGGDAERGAGVEVGAGVRYADGKLSIEADAHTLLGHADDAYEQWGIAAAIRLAPGPQGAGLSLSVAPAWGMGASDPSELWTGVPSIGADPRDGPEPDARVKVEVGYGVALAQPRSTVTPYAGATLASETERTVRGGARWEIGPDASLSLEAARRGSGQERAENLLRVEARVRF